VVARVGACLPPSKECAFLSMGSRPPREGDCVETVRLCLSYGDSGEWLVASEVERKQLNTEKDSNGL
jgi:hypothetical protein